MFISIEAPYIWCQIRHDLAYLWLGSCVCYPVRWTKSWPIEHLDTPDICRVFDTNGTPRGFIKLAIGIMDYYRTFPMFLISMPLSNEFWVYFQTNLAVSHDCCNHICLLRLLNMKPITGDFWNNLRSSSLRRDCADGREMVELFPLGCTRRPLIDRELSKKVNGCDWSIE